MRYREQQPTFIPPMLLTSGPVPSGDAWTLELKWDGCRAQLCYDGRSVSLRTRRGRECSADFPELAAIAGVLGKRRVTLYLRSFREDAAAQYTTLWGRLSQEQQMARVLGRIGPVIALGAPGDSVPPLGAARDYPPPEQWPTWLAERMHVASLVLCRASDTEAFWSEVAMAQAIVAEPRIAFLLPRDADRYSAFRTRLADHFPTAASLPAVLPPVSSGAIFFLTREGHRPTARPLGAALLRHRRRAAAPTDRRQPQDGSGNVRLFPYCQPKSAISAGV